MSLRTEEAGAFASLSRFHFFGAKKLRSIFDLCHSYRAAYEANSAALLKAGLSETEAASFIKRRNPRQPEKDALWLKKEGIRTLTADDPEFPALLREISDPPAALHCLGSPAGQAAAVAIVGTLRASRYGLLMAESISRGLTEAGLIVVSGLAIGIDSRAHLSALKANGKTWAFLGSGLNAGNVYPPSNRGLAREIIARGGALFSEFPPGVSGYKHIFPIRNRLIAGSTLGTIVIEAGEKSGSLITASAALDYGREIFALPGDVRSELSRGPHSLLRRGACLIESADDVLKELGFANRAQKSEYKASDQELPILNAIAREPVSSDDLSRVVGLTTTETARILSLLEIRGAIIKQDGGLWARTY